MNDMSYGCRPAACEPLASGFTTEHAVEQLNHELNRRKKGKAGKGQCQCQLKRHGSATTGTTPRWMKAEAGR